jgi:hypothetical protein
MVLSVAKINFVFNMNSRNFPNAQELISCFKANCTSSLV